ncbi:g4453 [Coccomyxa elongata]
MSSGVQEPLIASNQHLQVERKVVIEAIDENHCRHRVEGEVHSDAHFGIGKLAEHMVIDSTVKTVERLPEITERYLEVRREMMKSPEGRKALLEGVPDVVIEVAELEHILQASASSGTQWLKPYEEPQPRQQMQEQLPPQEQVETGPVVQEADVAATEQGAKTGEVIVKPPSPRPTTDVIPDVEVAPGKEAEWQCVCEAGNAAAGDTAANRATVVALEEDREDALRHLHSLSPSKVEKVVLKDLKHSHLLSHHERKAVKHLLEDGKQRQRRNENIKNWRKFWRKCNPATCPVGNEAARVIQLVNLGSAVGLVELDEKGEVKAVVAEATPEPDTTPKEHKERRGGIKKVFERLHLSKRHEE